MERGFCRLCRKMSQERIQGTIKCKRAINCNLASLLTLFTASIHLERLFPSIDSTFGPKSGSDHCPAQKGEVERGMKFQAPFVILQAENSKLLKRYEGTVLEFDKKTFAAEIIANSPLKTMAEDAAKGNYFGVRLEKTFEQFLDNHMALQLIAYLENNAIDVDRLFASPGNAKAIAELKSLYDTPDEKKKNESPKVELGKYKAKEIAGVLRSYIFELPEPLLTKELYKKFVDTYSTLSFPSYFVVQKDITQRISTLRTLVAALPMPNKILIKRFVKMLSVIASYSKLNMMNSHELAKNLGTLFLSKEGTMTSISKTTPVVNELLRVMIENYKAIFEDQ